MDNRIERFASGLIGVVVGYAQRHCLLTIVSALAVTLAGAWFTASNVRINTNTADMLSDRLPWRAANNEYKAAFPYFTDTIIVVVDAVTPDLAIEAADTLALQLRQNTTAFTEVFHPAADPFFRRNQFLYLDLDELQTLGDDISAAQPFLARLAGDPGLHGFMQLLSDAAQAADEASGLKLDAVFNAVAHAIDGLLDGDQTAMSWQRLMVGDALAGDARAIFTVQPKIDFGSIRPGHLAVNAIREGAAALGLTEDSGVRVRLTGGVALSYDELNSVVTGTERAGVLALVMVAVCLIVGLRSLSLVAATLITLVVGLVLTAAFAVAAVGTLNMISIAFAVLYVGLGVDFAIHLCLRYRELTASSAKSEALSGASTHVGMSIALCALTTAIGFFAFIPTAYRGVAELGLISGVSMFIGLACSFTVLPALLQVLPTPRFTAAKGLGSRAAELPQRRAPTILKFTVVVAVVAAVALPLARFDHNPIHLNNPKAESVTTFMELLDDADEPPYSIDLIAPSSQAVAEVTTQLEQSPVVRAVTSAFDIVPSDQDRKLAAIEDLALIMGGDLELAQPQIVVPQDILQITAMLAARSTHLAHEQSGPLREAATALDSALKRLHTHLESADSLRSAAVLESLERKLMHHFAPQVERLAAGLEASEVELASLPEGLRRRWVTDDGRFRVEIHPAHNLDDNVRLAAFVNDVRAITGPGATGVPVINIEASRAVTAAFYQAFVSALIVIVLVLLIVLRQSIEVLVVMASLLLAGLLTAASTVLAGIPFNFANIIALPLLMGIGVGSGLHILYRYKTLGRSDAPLLKTSTARAVIFSALTTAASFGNLAISPHAGTASMGVMLTIGLGLTVLCMLVVLPALLARYVEPPAQAR